MIEIILYVLKVFTTARIDWLVIEFIREESLHWLSSRRKY